MLKLGGQLIVNTLYQGYPKNVALVLTGELDQRLSRVRDSGDMTSWSWQTPTELLIALGLGVTRFTGLGKIVFFWDYMPIVARTL